MALTIITLGVNVDHYKWRQRVLKIALLLRMPLMIITFSVNNTFITFDVVSKPPFVIIVIITPNVIIVNPICNNQF